jgi:hypothetical protein
VKTWRERPATNPSGSDNLLAEVWALISPKYSLFKARRLIHELPINTKTSGRIPVNRNQRACCGLAIGGLAAPAALE